MLVALVFTIFSLSAIEGDRNVDQKGSCRKLCIIDMADVGRGAVEEGAHPVEPDRPGTFFQLYPDNLFLSSTPLRRCEVLGFL